MERFDDWQSAYESAERGVKITEFDGSRLRWSKPVGDKEFQRPFFNACVAVLARAAEAREFDELNRAAAFTIGVEISSGDHARFWQLR